MRRSFSTVGWLMYAQAWLMPASRVIVAGLDMDFAGKPFGPMPALMAVAEYITKVHAICVRCGNLANYSFRKINDDKVVILGEKDIYEPICRSCYIKSVNR